MPDRDLSRVQLAALSRLRARIAAGDYGDDHPTRHMLEFMMYLYSTGRLDDGPGTNRFSSRKALHEAARAQRGTASEGTHG